MTAGDDPMRAVRALVAAEPAKAADRPALAGRLQRLCRAAAKALPASGVGVSVLSGEVPRAVLSVGSSTRSERVEQLQFTLGQGPCLEAFTSGRPVLIPNLPGRDMGQLVEYARAAQEHGVNAVFAFPLQIGAARLGALDVYRSDPEPLAASALTQAMMFAEVALWLLLDVQEQAREGDGPLVFHEESLGFEIYQAQGMLQVQLGVSLSEAMMRLRAYAYAHDLPLGDVAADIVARRLVLDADE